MVTILAGNPCFDDGELEMAPKSDREEVNFLTPTENGFGKNHNRTEKRKAYIPESKLKKGHYIAGTFVAVIALVIAISLVTWYLLSRQDTISDDSTNKALLNTSIYNKQGLPDPGERIIIKHLMTPSTTTTQTNKIINNNVTVAPVIGKIGTVTPAPVKVDEKFLKELKEKLDTLLCTDKSSGDSQDDQNLYTLGQKNTDILWDMYNKKEGWIMQGPEDLNLTVKSALIESIDKHIFRLKAKVHIPADQLFIDLIENVEKAPKWNPTVKFMEILHTINTCTDIIYQISAEMADGYVSSRDFVSLRHWERRGDVLLASAKAVEFDGMPPQDNYTRGEFFNGGMVLEKIPGDPGSCIYYWFFNADMKGWIPPMLLEVGLVDAMVEYLVFLEDHIKNLKANVKY